MPKLVAVDLSVGRVVRLNGIRHRIDRARPGKGKIDLLRDDGTVEKVSLSRSALCARIVDETAHLEDDIEDPDAAADQPEVNITRLAPDRLVDWWHRMILLRHLLPHAHRSPRSEAFRRECERARAILAWVKEGSAMQFAFKNWTDKTLNDILRRWRHHGYALAALQKKGLQYCPWQKRKTVYRRSQELIKKIKTQHPDWSASAVHRMAALHLRKESEAEVRDATPSASLSSAASA